MQDYDFNLIEQKWQKYWKQNQTFAVREDINKPKYYVLDMFPYPSGAGLHVGHPLGYIASDIYARYKRLEGYNVLHPMGYDSFGLPAEQYAIQTGQHPTITTEKNINRYREQLDKIGFSFDWSREVRTSDPSYYKWTQWIFRQIYSSYYNTQNNKAEAIENLIAQFEKEGNKHVHSFRKSENIFTAQDWKNYSDSEKEKVLQHYRLAYLAPTWVNWCPALGTVLANDEVINGVSERGGHPVIQKQMLQWNMCIRAYVDRLLAGLDALDWPQSVKDQQKNWMGRSTGALLYFQSNSHSIEIFTTRPDTLYGVSFLALAPEHPLADGLTSATQKEAVQNFKLETAKKSERERMANVKKTAGIFTGSYALHPLTGKEIPIYLADYVLSSYGTGAVMGAPAGDSRDYLFAQQYHIEIPNIFKNHDLKNGACEDKNTPLINSALWEGLSGDAAIEKAVQMIEDKKIGKKQINYRLRDAVFSRQRYWGEPFPIYYKENTPYLLPENETVLLPEIDQYLPTENGEPPLARAKKEAWNIFKGERMEYNTMPGWAGSSWYFLRYLDPKNEHEFAAKDKIDYWQNVDLYIGGSEHATGHLLYARFWSMFLHDRGFIPFEEPFKKMINQGMILGVSSFVYRLNYTHVQNLPTNTNFKTIPIFISKNIKEQYEQAKAQKLTSADQGYYQNQEIIESVRKTIQGDFSGSITIHNIYALRTDISFVHNNILDIEKFKNWPAEYQNAEFILEDDGTYICGSEVEKMSKSKFNVQTPDELVEKFGADTLRCYEMFLGPLEQFKPWDTKGINGVHNFLRKFWRLFHHDGEFMVSAEPATKEELKILHKAIKRMQEDLDRYVWNTVVSTFMIAVNELSEIKCKNRTVLEQLTVLLSPYAPHIAEEIWEKLGRQTSISEAKFPVFEEKYLTESEFEYPISINGKTRLKLSLSLELEKTDLEKAVLADITVQKYLENKPVLRMIAVKGKIINIVI